MESKHFNAVTGGYTKWIHKNGFITKADNEHCYRILHFVTGMDGNDHRVYWSESSLEAAVEYLEKFN